ncbi:UNVERIFIED_CONTAM: hypothetical protein FKN15_049621 [Acipenser sinensis]
MEPEIEDKTLELMVFVARLLPPGREHVCTEVPAEHAQCPVSSGASLLSLLCCVDCDRVCLPVACLSVSSFLELAVNRSCFDNTSVMEAQNEDDSPKKSTVFQISNGPSSVIVSRKRPSEGNYEKEKDVCIKFFDQWSESDQVEFVEHLISHMCHYQHGHINTYLKPMLQRDFITALPAQGLDHIAENILSFLDARSLCAAELVCKEWQRVISEGMLWKKLIERMVRTDPLWKGLSERHQWEKYLFKNRTTEIPPNSYYRSLYPKIIQDIETIEANWRCGRHNLQRIQCRSENSKGVYCLQYDDDKIISGLRDNSIKGLDHIAENILSFLDARSLCAAELVCKEWQRVISEGMLWKKLIERMVRTDPLWKGLSERHQWEKYLFKNRTTEIPPNSYYRSLYPKIIQDIETIEANWRCGRHNLQRIQCRSENSKGVYCLQYDDDKIISGLRDNSIKIWDKQTLECLKILTGHTGSVLCLQYDERVIVTGSSDSTVRVWDVNTGEVLNTLIHHNEAVLHLRFCNGLMVTCSKDRSIAVWDMASPTDISLRRVLVGHRAAVNVVDFDDKYIVSASGDRTIKVWSTSTCEFVRTLNGHKRGIACLQYRDRLVVSGSSDNTIRLWDIECGACLRVLEGHEELVRCIRFDNKRIVSGAYDGLWDIECGACLRVLEGHEELVRCIRFDNKRIVSGAYDGKIKVWDLQAALDPRAPASTLCLRTLVEHSGRVFRLQFDEFQIISSSHDDTILIWDFLNVASSMAPNGQNEGRSPSRTYTYISR